MGVARSYHVPQPNSTVAVLLRATALLDFRNRDGDLDLQWGSKQIVDALGKTRGGAARADYDMAFRNVVAAVARVSGQAWRPASCLRSPASRPRTRAPFCF